MKLVTFEVETLLGRFSRIGALMVREGSPSAQALIVDLNAAYAWLLREEGEPEAQRLADVIVPANMRRFIEMGPRALDAAQDTLNQIADLPVSGSGSALNSNPADAGKYPKGLNQTRLVFLQTEVQLKTPLPEPNMFRDFFAFEQHVAVGYKLRQEPIPEAWYKIPVYYKGNHRSLIGPNEPVQWPSYTRRLDYELELGCVLGRQGRNLSVQDAADVIFGYTIVNDFSARDIQKHEMQCRLGPAKGKDFGTAIGPYLVTKDEISDVYNLTMTARINGEEFSRGNSKDIHFTFEEMISHLSQDETVHPGDIIASGTVGTGCGLETNHWLSPHDDITLEIDCLGQLQNKILPPIAEINLLEAFPNKKSQASAQ